MVMFECCTITVVIDTTIVKVKHMNGQRDKTSYCADFYACFAENIQELFIVNCQMLALHSASLQPVLTQGGHSSCVLFPFCS
jgi:hypothetical protein